jgi:hypothetical protein
MCFSVRSSRSAAARISRSASSRRPFGERDPGLGGGLLYLDLLGPVDVARLGEAAAQLAQPLDGRLRGGRVAAARRAERLAEPRDGLRHRVGRLRHRQRRGLGPGAAVEGVAHEGGGEAGVERVDQRRRLGDRPVRREEFRRRPVLRQLHVGVGQEVHGMVVARDQLRLAGDARVHLAEVLGVGGDGGAVGGDRLLPQPERGEDVRGHVQRVPRGGREGGVAPRRRQAALSERGEVVGVDEVVHDAGVVRHARVDPLQDRARLQLPGVGLVGEVHGLVDGERVEDLRSSSSGYFAASRSIAAS